MLISNKLILKTKRLCRTYSELIFAPIGEVAVEWFETKQHLREVPRPGPGWRPASNGTPWGEPWGNAWFVGTAVMPQALDPGPVFLRAQTDGMETLFWVNGVPRGIFTHAREAAMRGNHHTLLLAGNARAGERYEIALESYAGHSVIGTQPFDRLETQTHYPARYPRIFNSVTLMVRREDVKDFVFDLQTLCQLVDVLPDESFRRAKICCALEEVFAAVLQSPTDTEEAMWRPLLAKARQIMRPVIDARNAASAPVAGLIGHSHLDTAWMWPIDETIRKCARTYSNALSLMDQYPEYTFIQSTPYHTELMRRYYPAIFQGIKNRVAEGRWEPNGGMWIECDCNLTAGESMIRQFLKGQAYTRKQFGYQADTFWLPDTFGYSAAIPQILLGCGIRYFLTTKLTWNETNTFPFDTFWWRGLDGSKVFSHFNDTQCWPDAATLVSKIAGGGAKDFRVVENYIQHKDVNDRRLISYGFGDGGGGPQYEMIEMARRCQDLEGCPRATHTTVSKFMAELETTSRHVPVYSGELYFEGHRGTLTALHNIKRGNRKAEFALRELEFLHVLTAEAGQSQIKEAIQDLWEVLLVNQFHDILPGTAMPEVNDRAISELSRIVSDAMKLRGELAGTPQSDGATLYHSLSWIRSGTISVEGVPEGKVPADEKIASQWVGDLQGKRKLLLKGLDLMPLSATWLPYKDGPSGGVSPFRFDGKTLETPGLRICFDDAGYISSLVDLSCGRELRGAGHPLNAFLMGEDVPEAWDNWDIDAEQKLKLELQQQLVSREIAADGPLEFRLRSEYRIGRHSVLRQDMVFFADSPRIEFETMVDWRDPHQLLKVGFDLRMLAPSARHEIQFGHLERPAYRNNSYEKVMFEVSNYKWTDLSENRYGVALLNDCKYGISVDGSDMRLTLIKSGGHPDPRGERGVHYFTYALLPHAAGFDVETVIRPAYELNIPVWAGGKNAPGQHPGLFEIEAANVICEAIKPAEDGHGYIVRLYEAERSAVRTRLVFVRPPARVILTNMIEEAIGELEIKDAALQLEFRAFEIKTLRIVP